MKNLRPVAALLLALPLLAFGGNAFLELFELPEGDGSSGDRLLQAMRDGGLMPFIAASHVLVGVFLLLPRTRFAAALLQLPISLGILAFHLTMLPAGIVVAVVMVALNLLVLADAHHLTLLLSRRREYR